MFTQKITWQDLLLMVGLLGGAGAAAPGLFALAFSRTDQNGWPDQPWQWLCLLLGMLIVAGLLVAGVLMALR